MHNQRSTAGFAQLMVLSGLAVLSALVLATYDHSLSGLRLQAGLQRLYDDQLLGTSAARRVFAAIEDDSDPLELPLVGVSPGPGTISISGEEVDLALEHEAGKLSAWKVNDMVFSRYLASLAQGQMQVRLSPHVSLDTATDVRNAMTVPLIGDDVDFIFEGDFSRFHSANFIAEKWASDQALAAAAALNWSDQAHEQTDREISTLVINVDRHSSKRYTFMITGGGQVTTLGAN